MPWCPACERFLSPANVRADGTCPTCGQGVDPGAARRPPTAGPDVGPEEPLDPVPWHFKLLLAAVALYLGYRAYQGVDWLVGRL